VLRLLDRGAVRRRSRAVSGILGSHLWRAALFGIILALNTGQFPKATTPLSRSTFSSASKTSVEHNNKFCLDSVGIAALPMVAPLPSRRPPRHLCVNSKAAGWRLKHLLITLAISDMIDNALCINESCSVVTPCIAGCFTDRCTASHVQGPRLPASDPRRGPCDPCFGLSAPERKQRSNGTLRNVCQLHLQKAGTEFWHTVLRFACPGFAEEDIDALWATPRNDRGAEARWSSDPRCNRSTIVSPFIGHDHANPLGAGSACPASNIITFLREPTQRFLSAAQQFSHDLHFDEFADHEFAESFHAQQLGCMTRALVGGAPGCLQGPHYLGSFYEKHGVNNTADLLPRALETLRSLAFVGLTDRWRDSVCLFHAKHGGVPRPRQFGTLAQEREVADGSQQTRGATCSKYDTSCVPSWLHDTNDGVLYREAVAIFERDMRKWTKCRG